MAPTHSLNPCAAACVRTATPARGQRVGHASAPRLVAVLFFLGRRAYDVEGLAAEAVRVLGATAPQSPRQTCQGHDERHDEGQRHELSQEVKNSQPLHCAREHAPSAQSGYPEHSHAEPLTIGLRTRTHTELVT